LIVEDLDPCPDPVSCCERLSGLPYRVFLDSASRGTRLGRYSFLCADPIAVVRSKGKQTECVDLVRGIERSFDGDALAAVRELLAPHMTNPVPGLPPFQGGAAGYLAYDWGRVLERLPEPRFDDLALPDVMLAIFDWVLAWDHDQSRAWLISTGLPESSSEQKARRASDRASKVLERLERSERFERSPRFERSERFERSAPSFPVESGWWTAKLELRSSFTHAA
jgi:para-aminobenzoate synthetase component 1